MAAVILTLVLTIIVAGITWLVVGNRFELSDDVRQNEVANLLLYCAVVLPFAFVIVFFAMERL
jgi:cytochrome bd-type quinol oxidase subunit 2